MALRYTGLLTLAGIWLLLVLFVVVIAVLLHPCSYTLDPQEEGFRLIPETCITNVMNGVYDWRVLLIPVAAFLLMGLGALFVHYLAAEIGVKVAEEMPLHRFAQSLNDFSQRLDETTASFPTGHVEQRDVPAKHDSIPFVYDEKTPASNDAGEGDTTREDYGRDESEERDGPAGE